jgi:uncharacterized glyoxalase superfamily protein PhnB
MAAAPDGLALYLVYLDVGVIADWLVRVLGFVDEGRSSNAEGIVTNVELTAGATTLMLELGDPARFSYPRGTRWTGVWVDDPDEWYGRLTDMGVNAKTPEDEPWGVRLVSVTDPEGHVWALIRRSA